MRLLTLRLHGLLKHNRSLAQRPGVASLIRVARLKQGSLTAESIGFGLGPRINAAGRCGPERTSTAGP